jgi:hypothetical protein
MLGSQYSTLGLIILQLINSVPGASYSCLFPDAGGRGGLSMDSLGFILSRIDVRLLNVGCCKDSIGATEP